ncbi:UNVERIFIED_CONTAM: hypothetical protein GTU68_067334 [Idotea baltica]|nr:hypothetical protein [Idotea baltica]
MRVIRSSSTAPPISCRWLPSGVCPFPEIAVIGNGVVVDPGPDAQKSGEACGPGRHHNHENIRFAENATLILPLHRELDQLREEAAAGGKIGTPGGDRPRPTKNKVGRRANPRPGPQKSRHPRPKVERILSASQSAFRRGLANRDWSPRP